MLLCDVLKKYFKITASNFLHNKDELIKLILLTTYKPHSGILELIA